MKCEHKIGYDERGNGNVTEEAVKSEIERVAEVYRDLRIKSGEVGRPSERFKRVLAKELGYERLPIEFYGYCPYCGRKLKWNEGKFSKEVKKRLRGDKNEVKRVCGLKGEEEEGYVYVVKMGKHYKIGISKTPESRLREFTKLPYELQTVLLVNVRGYAKREKELHERYKRKRVRGEWFLLNERDINWIKRYLERYKK